MIPPLITLDLAKNHLHILGDDLDIDIDSKRILASRIVVGHCKLTVIPDEWIMPSDELPYDSPDLVLISDVIVSPTETFYIRVPADIQAAILLVLGDLFENRESSTSNVLSQTVIDLLTPFRDPTMA